MAKCMNCSAQYSVLKGSYGDGLCESCHQAAVAERERKKTEEQRQLTHETSEKLDQLIKSLIDREPICNAFIVWDVEKTASGFLKKLPGLVAGAALGGVGGEILFGGTLLADHATYGGKLGLLLLSDDRLIIAHTTVPFTDPSGEVVPEHVQLLWSQCESHNIKRLEFDISSTQVTMLSGDRMLVESNTESLVFKGSPLHIGAEVHAQPSLTDIQAKIEQAGALPTPTSFAMRLLKSETPGLSQDQFEYILRSDCNYLHNVVKMILTLPNRDQLDLSPLTPPIQEALLERLHTKAQSHDRTRLLLWISGLLAIVTGTIGYAAWDDDTRVMFWFACFITGIATISFKISLGRALWCRQYLDNLQPGSGAVAE
jgi:hypothetical protein